MLEAFAYAVQSLNPNLKPQPRKEKIMNKIERRRSIPPTILITVLTVLTLIVMTGEMNQVMNQVQGQWATIGDNINNTNTGNVGIGTTTPPVLLTVEKDYNGPTVVGVFNTADGTGAQAGLGVSRTTDYANKYFLMGVTAPSFSLPGFGETAYLHSLGVPIKFGTQSAHDIYFFTNGISNTKLTIASGGNIGIGTTTPNSRFVIKQSADSFIGGLHLTRQATADTWSIVTGGDNNLYFGYANNASGANSASDFTAYPLVLSAFGNVGIGTPGPGYKLDVQGGQINSSGGLCIAGDCRTSWSQVGGGGGGSSQWTTSGSNIYYNSGNVGIGTTVPGSRLTVAGVIQSTSGGIKFPDGTVQTTSAVGHTVAVCVNGCSQNGNCSCQNGTVSKVLSPCTVTSDTGSCSASSCPDPAFPTSGSCCVCRP
jgi:hypothetical protein